MEKLNGFINADKPEGMTSHDVCMIIRKIFSIDSVGHAGTLDPMVTGVLPVAIGKATKLLQYLKHDKEYVGVMQLHQDIDDSKLKDAIKEFTGKIKQTPPRKCSVKRVEREREVYSFEIIERHEKQVLFRVHCEAGTYIRKLVSDLGDKLGIGAHMLELRRTKAGEMKELDSYTLYQISEAFDEYKKGNPEKLEKIILPMEMIAENYPKINVKAEALVKIYNGSPIYSEYISKQDKSKKGDIVAVICNEKLVEMAKITNEANAIAKPETVIKAE